MTVDDENLGPQNFDYRAEYGVSPLEIDPNTDSFQPGLFRVTFVTDQADQSENASPTKPKSKAAVLSITLILHRVPKMTKLYSDGQAVRSTLNSEDKPVEYFRYSLSKYIDFNSHWVLVQLSKKNGLRAYLHWTKLPGPEVTHYE